MDDLRGWYSRGYLPHQNVEGAIQFITWRTADSLPANILVSWKEELASSIEPERRAELARRVEAYCDEGHGGCLLRDPRAARVVQDCIFHDHPKFYTLHAWLVMPNHVHVLLTPCSGVKLDKIMNKVKSASAKDVNRLVAREGRFWQPEYFDRRIRDQEHFDGVKRYIEWNPVKAKLCPDPAKWAWSSCSSDARARLKFLTSHRDHN